MIELDVRCTTITDLATRYLADMLAPDQLVSYETHLVFCPGCTAFLSDMRDLCERLTALPADPVDPEERRIIVEAAADEP